MNRKQRRAAAKIAKKSGNPDLEKKLLMASNLSDKCRACLKDFDNNDVEMLDSWIVVVREEESKSHLYCPECWEKATELIKDMDPD